MSSSKENTHNFSYIQEQEQPELQKIWSQIRDSYNLQDNQYTSKQITIEWLRKIHEMKRQELGEVSYEDTVTGYLREVHQLDQNNITNIQFRFPQALQLLNWYRKHNQIKSSHQQNQQNQAESPRREEENEQVLTGKQKEQQQHEETYMYPHSPQKDDEEYKNQKKSQEQNVSDKQQKNLQESNEFGVRSEEVRQIQEKENQEKTINRNYKEYLKLVFDHYCRMSYATGNDPTFEQIQHKTNVMTINKFMIFCKEFGVVKLNSINRSYLLELFRKNAQLYKQMNFEQFVIALVKISQTVYGEESKEQPSQDSKQFEQFLLFLEVNNLIAFKKKMQTLNIAYRPKNSIGQIKKPELKDYKFKYGASNGRTEEQIRDEIIERKKIRSQQKLKIVQKKRKDRESQPPHLKNLKSKPNTSSAKEKLAPPKPPIRRVTTDNAPKKTSAPSREETDIVGYANIYRMKKNKQGSNWLRLNSIVEDAKKLVQSNQRIDRNANVYQNYLVQSKIRIQGRDTPLSDYNYLNSERDITNSDYSRKDSAYELGLNGSRNLSGMLNPPYRYEANHYSKVSKNKQENRNLQDLGELLGSDEEEDEYLNEHLHREKRNDHITKRIQAKIKAINQE